MMWARILERSRSDNRLVARQGRPLGMGFLREAVWH
jgi:hypothetical protein